MAKSGTLNLHESELHVMEMHPSEEAIKHSKQIPYHLQYIRKQKENNKNQQRTS